MILKLYVPALNKLEPYGPGVNHWQIFLPGGGGGGGGGGLPDIYLMIKEV